MYLDSFVTYVLDPYNTLPQCFTLRSEFWNGGQELAEKARSHTLPSIRPKTLCSLHRGKGPDVKIFF